MGVCFSTACFSSTFKFSRSFSVCIFSMTREANIFLKSSSVASAIWGIGIAQQPEDFIPALTNALDCPSVSFSLQKRLNYKTASSMSKWGHQTKMIWIHSESVRPLININKLVPSLECNCFHHISQQASLFFFSNVLNIKVYTVTFT